MRYFEGINKRKSLVLLITGFTLNLFLFATVIVIGIKYLQDASNHMHMVAYSDNSKMEQIVAMHEIARNRTLSLYVMINQDDAFEREQEYERFLGYGSAFILARSNLLAMELSPEERNLVEQQGKLTRIAVPFQRRVVDLVQQDAIKQARIDLEEKVIPAQNNVLVVLKQLLDRQLTGARRSADLTQAEHQNVSRILLLLGSIAIIIGFAIAFFVTRLIGRSEKQLSYEKELAETTLYSIAEAVISTDIEGIVQTINPVAERLTGWFNGEAIGKHLSSVFKIANEDDTACEYDPVAEALIPETVKGVQQYYKLYDRAGMECIIEHTVSPIKSGNADVSGVILVFRDVSGMHALTNQLSYQASHDALTGLINRREFEVRLEQMMRIVKSEQLTHALLYLDLDQFKVINDTCGHVAGDELLKQLAMNIKGLLRESDVLARLGGDEFGALLEGCSLEKAGEIAELILQAVRDMRFIWDKKSFNIGTSLGVVPITAESGTITDVLSAADSACYEAKERGRNRVHVFQQDDVDMVRRQMEMNWVHRIQEALEENLFILYFQEIIPLQTQESEPYHCEFLLRLANKDGTITPPMAFIPSAERYNLMPMIDRCVVDIVFDFMQGLPGDMLRNLVVTINISGQSLGDKEFQEYLVTRIQQQQQIPGQIIIEITETAAIANLSHTMGFINSLKKFGCKFALDDFGSGLSSFSYLKNLPVDYLKIDGTFVRDIIDDPVDMAFVRSINQIGHIMGKSIIAEYVENDSILNKLRDIGVDYAQGYGIAEPRPLEELLAKVKRTATIKEPSPVFLN